MCLELYAQEINFRHLSVGEGLSQSAVFSITQDELGYLWVGTADGLNRYNGYEFIHFRNRPNEPKSISDNFIYCLEPAVNGDMWVGTFGGGLNYFNARENTFKRFRAYGQKGDLEHNDIYAIKELDSALLVGTNLGLDVSYDKETFEYVYLPDSLYYIPYDIMVADNGDVLVAHDKGLSKWSYGAKYLELPNESFKIFRDKNLSAFCVSQISNGQIWIGTDDGIYVCNSKYELLNTLNPTVGINEGTGINSIYEDEEGNVWVGTNGDGLAIYNYKTGVFRSFTPDAYDDYSISDGLVTTVFQDNSGVVWIGTYHGGINKYDRYINQFRLYQHKIGTAQGLSAARVFSIYENVDGDVLVGTDGAGLNYIDHQFDKDGNIINVIYRNEEMPFKGEHIWAIESDNNNGLWIGTIGNGLKYFNTVTGEIKSYANDTLGSRPNGLSDNSVYDLMFDSDGYLWIGTDQGINKMDIASETFTHYAIDSVEQRIFNSNTVLAIAEDDNKNIWVGTFGGGITVIGDKGIKKRYRRNLNDTNSLSYDKVMSIQKDSKGKIWVGTFGGGFNIYQEQTDNFITYNEYNGLANDVVYGFLEDESGYMWMSTNYGLSAFNMETDNFRNFDESCNLQSNEFNQGAFCKGASGRFYFGGINGLNSFNPNKIDLNPYEPAVAISAFSAPGDLIKPTGEADNSTIELNYDNNNIFFEFVAFNYVNSHLNQYRYILEGLGQDWIEVGGKRSASFTNLSPGNYIFKVQAANNDGVWNTKGKQVRVVVLSPFYLKWWFQPMLFLLAISLVTLFAFLVVKAVRNRTKTQLVEADLKLSEAERRSFQYKLTSLRAQMDPHFIFNSLNSIQHFISKNDKDLARSYLSKFAKLMRLILNSSREETISLTEELDTLKLYVDLERLRFDYKFDYDFVVEDGLDPDEVEVPTMLLQPYIENAIIHGLNNKTDGHGILKLEASQVGEELCVIIEDNGIGRGKAQEIRNQKLNKYKSLGMQVTQDRLSLWSANAQKPSVSVEDLFDKENKPLGTRVKIFINVSFFD